MKTSTVILLAAISVLSLSSFKEVKDDGKTKKIALTSSFKKIVVEEFIKIVLVPKSAVETAAVTGNANLIEHINIDISRNKLLVSSEKHLKNGDDVTVYIPVENLSEIELENGAEVSAKGNLHFNNLSILVNIGSKVDLRVGGKIAITPTNDCEFVYVNADK